MAFLENLNFINKTKTGGPAVYDVKYLAVLKRTGRRFQESFHGTNFSILDSINVTRILIALSNEFFLKFQVRFDVQSAESKSHV